MKYFLLSSFLLFFSSVILYSQSGKIAGVTKDASTNEPLPFVNVIVEGTSTGAASNIDGEYFILNVSPGVYSVKASAIGYNSVTVQNVNVASNFTSTVDFNLSPTSIELQQDVVVIAEKPLVTKDLTSTTAVVTADEIANLPVTEFQEILQLKAGVVGADNNVRGGRKGEVVYAIDGVPVTDVYDGSTVVDVNANSIQELQFISGAFNAEFGKALSGYVNIATKDGDNEFEGNFTTYIGDYVSTNTGIFRAVDDVDPVAINNFELSLSGPIVPNMLYFYLNARHIYFGGWINGIKAFNPWDITTNFGASLPVEERYNIESTGDSSIVSMNWNRKNYGQVKLTFRPFTDVKINFNYIIDNVEYRDYDHSFAYNPDGDYKRFRYGNTNIFSLTHALSPTTFYQANLSYFFKKYRQYVYEDVNDPAWTHDLLLDQQPKEVPSFKTGGTQNSDFRRSTNTYGVKIDITSQVTQVHLLKAGIEFNQHSLSFNNITYLQDLGIPDPSVSRNPYAQKFVPDPNDPNENLNYNSYIRKPVELSAYLQDKVELSEMIINLGLRFDYFSPDGQVLNDVTDPDIYRPRRPDNIYTGDTNQDGQLGEGDQLKTVAERRQYWYKDAPTSWEVSPRLGVAFPITERGVIHFSYGHFFQTPSFELLYQNPEYKFGSGTGNLGVAGNPSLKPQQTISGEVGVQQALTDLLTVDLTAYFRDIRNLAGTRADEIRLFGGAGSYSQFVNSDFGFVKGVVLTITKQFSDNWSATLDYTLQSAKGNASDPEATRNQLAGGEQPEIQLIKLNWDQVHTFNATFTYSSDYNWGFSFIGQYGSGFPYTPTVSQDVSSLLTNSELKPPSVNIDFRAYKDFFISTLRLSIFMRIYNLLDISNENNVYNDSGTADFTIDEYLRRNDDYPDRLVNTLDEYYRNPTYYSEPRRVELGATIFF